MLAPERSVPEWIINPNQFLCFFLFFEKKNELFVVFAPRTDSGADSRTKTEWARMINYDTLKTIEDYN